MSLPRQHRVSGGEDVLASGAEMDRRRFLLALGATGSVLLRSGTGGASLARAVSLPELVSGSERALIGTTLGAESRWARVAGRPRIVTESRVRLHEALGGPAEAEVLVRTLGGKVGDIGQVVHGEAVLLVGEAALLFLARSPDDVLGVTAMGQGHYPIRADGSGQRRLAPSPRMAELLGDGAAKDLVGRLATDGAALVRKAWRAR